MLSASKPVFNCSEENFQIGKYDFTISFANDLTEVLDHYVKVSPSDEDSIPYYSCVWDSALALAEYIVANEKLFVGNKVLELGCGLGLPSLCAARCKANVLATDYHPDNKEFFLKNVELNKLHTIEYSVLDWRNPAELGKFDFILGSDLIYERKMIPHLLECIKKYLAENGSFIYADPGRAALQEFTTELEKNNFKWKLKAVKDIYIIISSKN